MEEDLNLRLNSIQNQILDLYEKRSTNLEDHITLWNLIRKENALFYFAKTQGLSRLGIQTLPSRVSSQSSAKDAIRQVLYLQSLKDSRYGGEPWTLQETSKERLTTEPEYCFKKGGMQVDVMFDQDPENVARYTLWTSIYFQDARDRWVKAPGRADHSGLYYVDEEGNRLYYVDFAEEAMKFSSTAYWTVSHNGSLILPGTSAISAPQPADSTTEETPASTPDSSEVGEPYPTSTVWVAGLEAQGSEAGGQRTSTPRPARPQTPRQGRGGGGGGPGGGGGRRLFGRPGVSGRVLRRGGGRHSPRSQRVVARPGAAGRAPSAEEVGKSTKTVEGASRSRLERLLKEAVDPPFLGLKGEPNILKCVRYRLKGQHKQYFDKISTTWQWTAANCNNRCGDGRVLVLFKDEEQRAMFLERVKLPQSVKVFAGSAAGI